MTKKEVVWLIIRLAGLWFLWQGIENVLLLISSMASVIGQTGPLYRSAAMLFEPAIHAFAYLLIGLYALFDGRAFFHVLNRQPDKPAQN